MLQFISLLTERSKMRNRFRVELYDANKAHDITLMFEQGVDKDYLTELAYSNLANFEGDVKAYVYDELKKRKTTAIFIPNEIVTRVKSKLTNTAKELGLI